jgi:isoamylase
MAAATRAPDRRSRPVTGSTSATERSGADPLGATITTDGVNFSVYAKRAERVDLLLFDGVDDAVAARTIVLDPSADRTADYWHIDVPGLGAGQLYGFAAHGPWAPDRGLRFDPAMVLLDPYGRAVAMPPGYRRVMAGETADPSTAMKSVVVDSAGYDWEGDRPLGRPWRETIVYEAHLKGFTADPSSGVAPEKRGTYAGFIDRIPYLADLGITAVELLPVFQFDALAAPSGLINYWGYQPVSFFSPHGAYALGSGPTAAVDEFRDLVKALHRAGLEVILDVVYNHTAEVGADGPTFSFKGLANDDYYLLDTGGGYLDYSGTGNTFNANGPIVRRLIVDSLRYWVREMHVDGFRFDLAAVLSRDEAGRPMADPPALWDIESDPVLAGTKLIAEAWDAGGLYEVGSFVGDRWVEWNGRFRDDVRSFFKSDPGQVGTVVQRFLGSPDIYAHKDREPQVSLNFVTCHDGFTLNDVVSYDTKHNDANGEANRDGNDQNLSWNSGVEGPTDDPAVERLRRRQIKNFLTFELLAAGAPMLLMGDEVRRTQLGNNNDYCHDDPTSWFDWSGVETHAEILRFTKELIAARRRLVALLDEPVGISLSDMLRLTDHEESGVAVGRPDLGDESRSIALTVRGKAGALHLIFNAYWDGLDFELPPIGADVVGWRTVIDTSLDPPDDIDFDFGRARPVVESTYHAEPRSVVVLAARRATGTSLEGG